MSEPTRRRALLRRAGAIAAAALPRPSAMAQPATPPWPSRPITLLVPFVPGGLPDNNARFLAQRLAQRLGQPVVVENKGGAAGNIGTEAVARARPDGHTVLFGTSGTHGANRWLYATLPFDPVRDFVPVHALFSDSNILVVGANSPFRDLPSLLAFARANPERLTYVSGGVGTGVHLAGALFAKVAGVSLMHVPYRGTPAALNDVVAGRGDLVFDYGVTSSPLIADGRLRALAVTGKERLGSLPAVPTMGELGLKEAETMVWSGLFLPAGTPPAIAAALAGATAEILAEEETRRWADRYESGRMLGVSLDRFRTFVAEEIERWREIVAISGARLD